MTLDVVPVVHLDARRFPEYPGDEPERVLTELTRRFGRVAIVDVGGVRANDVDLEFIQKVARKRSLWLDGGSRYATDAMDLFVAGAEWVTLRWNTLGAEKELEEAASLAQPGALFVGLEFPHGEFLPNPRDRRSADEVVRLAEVHGAGIVYIIPPDAPPELARTLPGASTPRFVQGARGAVDLQTWGYQGALVPPTHLEEEAPP